MFEVIFLVPDRLTQGSAKIDVKTVTMSKSL